jgi:hypothetical protein
MKEIMRFSVELQKKMARLTAHQQRAILMIVIGGADGISLNRLLKTCYSCPHCGRVVGRSGEKAVWRKAALASHIERCPEWPNKWRFAATASTYYGHWKPNSCFTECLNQGRAEFANAAFGEAARILQLGALKAANEVVRQVSEGEKDRDKRAAAFGLLDRVDLKMADRTNDKLMRLLAELREDDEPTGDCGVEQDDWPPAEWDSGTDTP